MVIRGSDLTMSLQMEVRCETFSSRPTSPNGVFASHRTSFFTGLAAHRTVSDEPLSDRARAPFDASAIVAATSRMPSEEANPHLPDTSTLAEWPHSSLRITLSMDDSRSSMDVWETSSACSST